MKARWALLAGSLLLVTAMTLGISGVAPADPGDNCTLAKLDALYVLTASGFNIVSGVPQPKAIVELIRFNGDGTLEAPGGTVSINGGIFPIPIPPNPPSPGSYNIQNLASPGKGCEGSIAFTNGPTWFMFIPHDGKTLRMIQTNPNTVFQGTATKVSE